MRNFVVHVALMAMLSCSTCDPAYSAADAEGFRALFNGRDFDGWYPVLAGQPAGSDLGNVFSVDDDMIRVYAHAEDKSQQPHGYLSTRQEFSNFHLRMQYKWGRKKFGHMVDHPRDAGLLFHVVGEDRVWPCCLEFQIQEGDTGDLFCIEHGGAIATIDPESLQMSQYGFPMADFRDANEGGEPFEFGVRTAYGRVQRLAMHEIADDWNTIELVVRGDTATFIVNGNVVNRLHGLSQPDPAHPGERIGLARGRILLQSESAEVFYRHIQVKDLAPETADPTSTETASAAPPMTVPPGFEVQRVAGPPLVRHPLMACFDDRGRLFVGESAGINLRAKQLLQQRPHKILMLEDTNGDGRFDKRTVFADDLVLPNGGQWYQGALYVCSGPYLWRLEDTDDDGRADQREAIAGKFCFSGQSDSCHGPVLGPDGRLYWCGGQQGWRLERPPPNVRLHEEPVEPNVYGHVSVLGPWNATAPGVFSCWPDGSDAENLALGGTCNPVEVAFTPEGEPLGTVAVYDQLEGVGRRDAVLHWIRGGLFHLAERNHEGRMRTGEDLTPLLYLGHSAPAGIMRYRGGQFSKQYLGGYFFAEFNTQTVYHMTIEQRGSTFVPQHKVFLKSTGADVHLTDVLEDADGSLLVLDTGGWYRFGCPTSKIAKPSILGGIYRIRHTGQSAPADPWGRSISWQQLSSSELVKLLDDDRPAVRDRAIATLAARGPAAVGELNPALPNDSTRTRRNTVWTLCRIDSDEARQALRVALSDSDASVRQAAAHAAAVRRDQQALVRLADMVVGDEPAVRIQAAAALGQIGHIDGVPALLVASRSAADRFVEHAIIDALIRIGERKPTLAGLQDTAPQTRRAALIAIDQMPQGDLTRELVVPLLDTDDVQLQQTALEVISRRGWSAEVTGILKEWLREGEVPPQQRSAMRGALMASCEEGEIQQLVADALNQSATPRSTRQLLLEIVGRSRLVRLPEIWLEPLESHLAVEDETIVCETIAAIAACGERRLDDRLHAIAGDPTRRTAERVAAISAAAAGNRLIDESALELLLRQLAPDVDAGPRLAAARAAARCRIAPRELDRVSTAIRQSGPLELPALVSFYVSNDRDRTIANGQRLVSALEVAPGLPSLPAGHLSSLLRDYPDKVRQLAGPLMTKLAGEGVSQAARLEELTPLLEDGNAVRGQEVFFGKRASCAACHRVENSGGNIGPNLTGISVRRAPRDLLEAVVFPSASFARGYESYHVETSSGRIFSGVFSRETANAVFLSTAQRDEVRIARDDIESVAPAKVSMMPQGLDRTLSREELRDLFAYLVSLRADPKEH